ncbi:MAG: hypothetical protein ACH346_03145 [Chthoniobacterales bacterium]
MKNLANLSIRILLITLVISFVNIKKIGATSASSENLTSCVKIITVTSADYVTFLNDVAADDPHHLYDTVMKEGCRIPIIREGEPGHYSYECVGEKYTPVTFIDPLSAMRYCNWLENQIVDKDEARTPISIFPSENSETPSSDPSFEITEKGAYELASNNIILNPKATFTLTEDEENSLSSLRCSRQPFKIVVHSGISRLSMISPEAVAANTLSTEELANIAAAVVGVMITDGHRLPEEESLPNHTEEHREGLLLTSKESIPHQEMTSSHDITSNSRVREQHLQKRSYDNNDPLLKKSQSNSDVFFDNLLEGIDQERINIINRLEQAQQRLKSYQDLYIDATERRRKCSLAQKTIRRFRSNTQEEINRQIDEANLGIIKTNRDIQAFTRQLNQIDNYLSTPSLESGKTEQPLSPYARSVSVAYKIDNHADNLELKRSALSHRDHDSESDQFLLQQVYQKYTPRILPPENLTPYEKDTWDQNIIDWIDLRNKMEDLRGNREDLKGRISAIKSQLAEEEKTRIWFGKTTIYRNELFETEQKLKECKINLESTRNELRILTAEPGSKVLDEIFQAHDQKDALELAKKEYAAVEKSLEDQRLKHMDQLRRYALSIINNGQNRESQECKKKYNSLQSTRDSLLGDAVKLFEYNRIIENSQDMELYYYDIDYRSPFRCKISYVSKEEPKRISFAPEKELLDRFSAEEKTKILLIAGIPDWIPTEHEINNVLAEGKVELNKKVRLYQKSVSSLKPYSRADYESDASVLRRVLAKYGNTVIPDNSLTPDKKKEWHQNILDWVDARNRAADIGRELKRVSNNKRSLEREWEEAKKGGLLKKKSAITLEEAFKQASDRELNLKEQLSNESEELELLTTQPGSSIMYQFFKYQLRAEIAENANKGISETEISLAKYRIYRKKALLNMGYYIEHAPTYFKEAESFHNAILRCAIQRYEYSRATESSDNEWRMFCPIGNVIVPQNLTDYLIPAEFYEGAIDSTRLLHYYNNEEIDRILKMSGMKDWNITEEEKEEATKESSEKRERDLIEMERNEEQKKKEKAEMAAKRRSQALSVGFKVVGAILGGI